MSQYNSSELYRLREMLCIMQDATCRLLVRSEIPFSRIGVVNQDPFYPLPTIRMCPHLTNPLPLRTSALSIIHCSMLCTVIRVGALKMRCSLISSSPHAVTMTYKQNKQK